MTSKPYGFIKFNMRVDGNLLYEPPEKRNTRVLGKRSYNAGFEHERIHINDEEDGLNYKFRDMIQSKKWLKTYLDLCIADHWELNYMELDEYV